MFKKIFTREVLTEANTVTIDYSSRPQVCGFTIDSSSSKDLDDAIWIEIINNGAILSIHITDVSAYVHKNSALDKEALTRVETVYLAKGNIPMFPRILSEEKTSLLEGKHRPTLTVKITLDSSANIVNTEIQETLLISIKRFAYEEADLTLISPSKQLYPLLKYCEIWAKKLNYLRQDRGAIGSMSIGDLNLDEEGNITKEIQYNSQQIIAEFMILANMAIANFLLEKTQLGMYRNHKAGEIPEDRNTFIKSLRDLGSSELIRKYLQSHLKPAVYQENCEGHFALNLDSYCHFTSPIRRYADIVNHRIIKSIIKGENIPYTQEELEKIANHLNEYREQTRQTKKEIMKAKSQAIINQNLQDESIYSRLSAKEFTKLLEVANDENIGKLLPEIINRFNKNTLTLKDVALIIFKHELKLEELKDWGDKNPSDFLQALNSIARQMGKQVDFIYEELSAPPFAAWLVVDDETTFNPEIANSKKEAKQSAASQWLVAFCEEELVTIEERNFNFQNTSKIEKNTDNTNNLLAIQNDEIEEEEEWIEDEDYFWGEEFNEEYINEIFESSDNSIAILNNLSQQLSWPVPNYKYSSLANGFQCIVTLILEDKTFTNKGNGKSKKEAKQLAASSLLKRLKQTFAYSSFD